MRTSALLLLAACRVVDPKDPDAPADTDTAAPDTGDTAETDSGDPDSGDPDGPDTGWYPAPCEATCDAGAAALICASGASFPTVQAALDASVAEDVVVVCPGVWNEALVVPDHPLTIEGAGADVSVLDGGGAASVLDVTRGVLLLRDLTVQNGFHADFSFDKLGGGLRADGSDVHVVRVTFRGNQADAGGGLGQEGGDLVILDSRFEGNTSIDEDRSGGGVYYEGEGAVLIRGTTFDGNYAYGYSAGASITAASLLLADSTFTANETTARGLAGLNFEGGPVEVRGSTFADNLGGGLALDFQTSAVVADTVFTDNLSNGVGGLGISGGNMGEATASIERCSFERNTGASGAGLYLSVADPVRVVDSHFVDNHAEYDGGGLALAASLYGDYRFEGCTFTGNSARSLGGAVVWTGNATHNGEYGGVPSFTFDSCVFEENTAALGGALYFDDGIYTLVGGAVRRNVADWEGGGLYIRDYAEVSVTGADWGTGEDDNSPSDTNLSGAWGASATFTCTAEVCE